MVATFAFAKAFYAKELSIELEWKRFAKIAFLIEALAIFLCFAVLFYIIYNHRFEYKYSYSHSDKSMPLQYLLSCFWEGQEGSFLLWSFWHAILGLMIMTRSAKWGHQTSGVMMVLNIVQVCLATMIVGLYIADFKLGSSPFILLRQEMNWPILSRPDYLQFIKNITCKIIIDDFWEITDKNHWSKTIYSRSYVEYLDDKPVTWELSKDLYNNVLYFNGILSYSFTRPIRGMFFK